MPAVWAADATHLPGGSLGHLATCPLPCLCLGVSQGPRPPEKTQATPHSLSLQLTTSSGPGQQVEQLGPSLALGQRRTPSWAPLRTPGGRCSPGSQEERGCVQILETRRPTPSSLHAPLTAPTLCRPWGPPLCRGLSYCSAPPSLHTGACFPNEMGAPSISPTPAPPPLQLPAENSIKTCPGRINEGL